MLHADEIIRNAGLGYQACLRASERELFQFLCGWQSMAVIALITSVMILAMIYLFSVMFRNESLKAYVKLELPEVFITVIIIAILISGVASLSNIKATSLLGSGQIANISADATLYNITERYFEVVGDDMAAWLEMDYTLGVYVDSLASATPQPRPMGVGLVASPFVGLASPFKQLLYNCSTALSIAFIINYAQLYVFLFALKASLDYYLPLGIILRSFTPTRRIGGALLGLAISFLFIFPPLYAMNALMFYGTDAPMITFRTFMYDRYANLTLFSNNTNQQGSMANYYGQKYTPGVIDLVSEGISGIGRLFSSVIGEFFTWIMVFPISVIGRAFAIGFIMPVFDILLLVQATRYISKNLGEEVDISLLTRMI